VSGLLEAVIGSNGHDGDGQAQGPRRAFAYARVSTDMQYKRGLSIPEQLRDMRAYAEGKGIEIVEEFSEQISVYRRKGKWNELDRMVERAMSGGEVNAIIVHDLSRFSRESLDGKQLSRDLRARGVPVISLNDPEYDPETVAGVYVEAMTFAKNEAYSREVAFHTKKGCRSNIHARDPETRWCYKNGGQPLWGYRAERLHRGEERVGRPIIKCIWVPDERVVAGRPVHEWTRFCLVEMAAKGATLKQLRDFCNSKGIPAPRKQYWGHSTWTSLLHPHSLLQYAGYGIWNARGKKLRWNPPSEWEIEPNAHEPLITEEQAQEILAARRRNGEKSFDTGYHRSQDSPYLLSGGPFVCARCGSNMIGFRKSDGTCYYVCGSLPYRRGMGCGPGVYVRQAEVESEVIAGLKNLVGICTDPQGFTREVNEELRRIWEERVGYDPTATRRLTEIEAKIDNLWQAIEDGITDTGRANKRLAELQAEKVRLAEAARVTGEPPQIDVQTALTYRRDLEKLLARGKPADRKRIVRSWVEEIKLAPDRLEVDITYKLPEPVMNSVGAGAVFHP
jgi:site-specific DNA recombinase